MCREHARLREEEPSDLDPSGSGRAGVGEGALVGSRSEWSIRQGRLPGPHYSTVLIFGRLRSPLLTFIRPCAINASLLLAGSFSGIAKAVKRVGRNDRAEHHDEGRLLLSSDDSGSLHELGGASQKAPTELARHDALPAGAGSSVPEQKRVPGGHPTLQDGHPSSNGSGSAGPPTLQRLSFVKNPGLTNIQTPFSSSQALLDHPWQPQERPFPLESIAGRPPPAMSALIALACRLLCIPV